MHTGLLEITQNNVKNKKHPVTNCATDGNAFLICTHQRRLARLVQTDRKAALTQIPTCYIHGDKKSISQEQQMTNAVSQGQEFKVTVDTGSLKKWKNSKQ